MCTYIDVRQCISAWRVCQIHLKFHVYLCICVCTYIWAFRVHMSLSNSLEFDCLDKQKSLFKCLFSISAPCPFPPLPFPTTLSPLLFPHSPLPSTPFPTCITKAVHPSLSLSPLSLKNLLADMAGRCMHASRRELWTYSLVERVRGL